jgi:type II secretory pathway pseudopilin PulG
MKKRSRWCGFPLLEVVTVVMLFGMTAALMIPIISAGGGDVAHGTHNESSAVAGG